MRLFSHETINSIVAVVGLAIAVTTAWHQFGPQPDEIQVEVTGRFYLEKPFKKVSLFPDIIGEEKRLIAGPVFWRFVLYNNLDRPVSILQIETQMSGETRFMEYGDLEAGVYEVGDNLAPVKMPFSIQPRHAKAILVALNIPVVRDQEDDSCYQKESTLRKVETCFIEKGRDIFGNVVNTTEILSWPYERAQIRVWGKNRKSPAFLTMLRTGDGSVFGVSYEYYPFQN